MRRKSSGQSVMAGEVDDGPTVETWSDKNQRIEVSEPRQGFLYDLILRAKLDASPEEVYAVLIDPKSHEIFRGIKDTVSRTTLEDDGKGCRKLRVGHRAVTKFLWISVTFDTELFVWEDDNHRTIRFTNARSDGFMKKFDGAWNVQPFTQQTLDKIYKHNVQQQQQDQHKHQWLSPAGVLAAFQQRLHVGGPDKLSTLVTLEQAVAPRVTPPGPVAHLVRGLCARVVQNLMADLRQEVHRRQELETGGTSAMAISPKAAGHPPSLPVASITSSSMMSNGGIYPAVSFGRCSSSGASKLCTPREESSDLCLNDSSGSFNLGDTVSSRLTDLMSGAVPLNITVRL